MLEFTSHHIKFVNVLPILKKTAEQTPQGLELFPDAGRHSYLHDGAYSHFDCVWSPCNTGERLSS